MHLVSCLGGHWDDTSMIELDIREGFHHIFYQ